MLEVALLMGSVDVEDAELDMEVSLGASLIETWRFMARLRSLVALGVLAALLSSLISALTLALPALRLALPALIFSAATLLMFWLLSVVFWLPTEGAAMFSAALPILAASRLAS
ncbi:hypothetical protein FN846DRAFT_955021 [Sphaerosporella brunnea]|uniref:Uncharacterized protein n=1 Tax=Sphaerosporella brunnea TaxID=1250544 RepID=A0A5J5ETP2_9PEZI|nr:hypothetical protein FN846DRAFT_955021 [Sphaerosporella brunnea]